MQWLPCIQSTRQIDILHVARSLRRIRHRPEIRRPDQPAAAAGGDTSPSVGAPQRPHMPPRQAARGRSGSPAGPPSRQMRRRLELGQPNYRGVMGRPLRLHDARASPRAGTRIGIELSRAAPRAAAARMVIAGGEADGSPSLDENLNHFYIIAVQRRQSRRPRHCQRTGLESRNVWAAKSLQVRRRRDCAGI